MGYKVKFPSFSENANNLTFVQKVGFSIGMILTGAPIICLVVLALIFVVIKLFAMIGFWSLLVIMVVMGILVLWLTDNIHIEKS